MNDTATAKVPEPKELATIETDQQICRARYTPCGEWLLAGCYDSDIRRWKATGEEFESQSSFDMHRGWSTQIAFAHEKGIAFSADSWGMLCAWPYADDHPQPVWKIEQAHDGWIRSLAVSDDGKLLATCGKDQIVRVWSTNNGEMLHEFAGHEFDTFCTAISPDGKFVVSADLMGNIKRWDLAQNKLANETLLEKMHYYDRDQDVAGIRLLHYHNADTLLCTGTEPTRAGRSFGVPTITAVDAASLEITKTLHLGVDKDGYIFDLIPQGDDRYLVVACGPPGASKWMLITLDDEKPLYEHTKLTNTHSAALHPDGRHVLIVSTNRNSQGNGAVLDKDGEYRPNNSPLHLFDLAPEPEVEAEAKEK